MGAMDSSADLLFRISADSSDAQANIQRFRALMGKDLDGIAAEVGSWSNKVFGDLSTLQGGLIGVTAALGAGMVAAAGAMVKAASDAAKYAEEIEGGTEKTGMSAEAISGLRYAAHYAGIGYEALIGSLVKFDSTVAAAQDPTSKQAKALHALGISQTQINASTKDLLPLLYQVADAWRDHADGVTKTAMARTLFNRQGAELNEFLNKGSAGLKQLATEAQALGLILTEQDLVAAKAFRYELAYLKAEQEALWLSIGQKGIPALTNFAIGMEGIWGGIKRAVQEGGSLDAMAANFAAGMVTSAMSAAQRLQQQLRAAMAEGNKPMPGFGPDIKKGTEDFRGLTSILEELKLKLGAAQGEEAKLGAEFAHTNTQIIQASEELQKLEKEHKIAPEAAKRELAVLAQLPGMLISVTKASMKDLAEKRKAAMLVAEEDLQQRIQSQQEQTTENQERLWNDEVDKLQARLKKEKLLTEENEKLVAQLRQAGLEKLQRQQSEAFVAELQAQQRALAEMVTARFTSMERLRFSYDQDLARFSAVEEAKAKKTAKTEAERRAIEQQFEMNRAAAYAKYGTDLTVLYNSRGWQGVFGNAFAQAIRGNEQLLRQWAESANQSVLMVKVSLEALDEMGQKAFGDFAQAMGQNIAQAIVYKQSIGDAMRAALASTLESIAAQSFTYAIYATALGFLCLAEWDFSGAAAAFEAAAIFGTVGVASAIAGRAVAPKQAGAAGGGASGQGGSAADSSSSSSAAAAGGGSSSSGPSVTVIVQGHIIGRSGIEEVTDMINEAVQQRDVRLVATAVKQTARVVGNG
jgi:hypothetical protein